jgi:DNA polymerase III delta prime subunit
MIDPSHLKSMVMSGGGVAAIGAAIFAAWGYIRTGFRYIVGIVIGTSVLKDDAGSAAMSYAFSKAIRSPLGVRVFGGYESYVHPKRWREAVGYEGMSSDPFLVRYGNSYALVSLRSHNEGPGSVSIGEVNRLGTTVTIRYMRWFFNVEKFMVDALAYYNSEKRQCNGDKNKAKKNRRTRFKLIRFAGNGGSHTENEKQLGDSQGSPSASTRDDSYIEMMIMTGAYRLLNWNREDLQMKPEEGQSPFTGYPFPDEVGEAIKELQCWLANEKWFRSKSIPWRRGWLLYGQPGSGKSTLTRALGMTFDLPVYTYDLSSMTNNDLVHSWETMMSNTPCIALMEDIDSVFNKREYIGSTMQGVPHLTFDCLLNCISGIKQADGVFLIVTTNFIDKLDEALGIPKSDGTSSRPGRIDKAIHLGVMKEPQRLSLAKHILIDYPDLIEKTVAMGDGETAAQFQARCAGLALHRFWKDERFQNRNIEVMHFNQDSVANYSDCGEKVVSVGRPQYSDTRLQIET